MSTHRTTITQPAVFRERVRQQLAQKWTGSEFAGTIAQDLETGIFNFAIRESDQNKLVKKWSNPEFVQLYMDRLRSLLLNLSPDRVAALEDEPSSAYTVASMTHQEWNSDRWAELISAKSKRDATRFSANTSLVGSNMFTCRKCKASDCTFYLMQTRSCDEPMTKFIQCRQCETRWRE